MYLEYPTDQSLHVTHGLRVRIVRWNIQASDQNHPNHMAKHAMVQGRAFRRKLLKTCLAPKHDSLSPQVHCTHYNA